MNKSGLDGNSHMHSILPCSIRYLPVKRAGGYGFSVDVTPDFLSYLRAMEVDKELLETRARESFEAIVDMSKVKESPYARPLLGWQGNLLHHIALPYGNAAGMSFHENPDPGWESNNIDFLEQMATCLGIMTEYLTYAASGLYFQNKMFVLVDRKD